MIQKLSLPVDVGLKCFGVIIFLSLWTLGSHLLGERSFLLPGPMETLHVAEKEVVSAEYQLAFRSSLINLLLGASVGVFSGISFGVLSVLFLPFRSFFACFVCLLRPIPIGGWAPFAVLFFGTSPSAARVIIAIGSFWTAYLITEQALTNVRPEFYELAEVYGRRSKWQKLFAVALPASSPMILGGIRTAYGQAWNCLIAAELVGVSGLAQRMWEAAGMAQSGQMIVQLLSIGVLFGICDRLFRCLNKRIFPWAEHSSR